MSIKEKARSIGAAGYGRFDHKEKYRDNQFSVI